MKQVTIIALFAFALILCFCVLPAAAVLQEVTVKGTVSSISREKNTLTIENPLQYGCSYTAGSYPVCTYTATGAASLTGSVPADSAFTLFNTGDTVIATSIGGAGGSWITIAKLLGPSPAEEYVIDVVGDPGTITAPFAGDYALDLVTVPDCTSCYGTTCKATASTVNVLSGDSRVMVKSLKPREALLYNGRNDGSSIAVTFIKGEASSAPCLGGYGMTGPQPVSEYIVNVIPPIGFTGTTVTTQGTAPPEVTMPSEARPTHSGMPPIAAVGALALVALLATARRI